MATVTLSANECIAILKRLSTADSLAAESAFLKVARAYHKPETTSTWSIGPMWIGQDGKVSSHQREN